MRVVLLTLFIVSTARAAFLSPPNDTFYHWQYYHHYINTEKAWEALSNRTLHEVVVGICDTGVLASHEDLAGRVSEGYNFHLNNNDTVPTHPHGTFIAGLIAANSDNAQGVAGFSSAARILPLKAVDDKLQTSAEIVSRCVRYAADKGAKVIVLAIVAPEGKELASAASYARSRGALLVMGAGNQNKNISALKDDANILIVGASSQRNLRWQRSENTGSNFGKPVDVMAPGHSVLSTVFYGKNLVNGKYQYMSSTAGAAGLVAGLAALIWSAYPELSPDQVETLILKGADSMGDEDNFGTGIINAERSIELASGL